jgi:hypothetical protein
MSASLITVPDVSGLEITLAPVAIQARGEALATARAITTVEDEFDQAVAVAALRELQGLSRKVEDARTTVKRPVLDVGKKIDRVAKDFCEELDTEGRRLGKILGIFQEKAQREAAAERERLRLAEEHRLEELRKEQAKLEETFVATVNSEDQSEAFQQLHRFEERANNELLAIKQQVACVAPPKATGQITRTETKFELLDIAALHAARPDLTNIEPNGTAIRAALKAGARDVPGLRIWEETVVTTRS